MNIKMYVDDQNNLFENEKIISYTGTEALCQTGMSVLY